MRERKSEKRVNTLVRRITALLSEVTVTSDKWLDTWLDMKVLLEKVMGETAKEYLDCNTSNNDECGCKIYTRIKRLAK